MSEGIRIIPRIETPQQRERRLEAGRRSKARQENLVPIYVMWTSDVSPSLAQAGLQGVYDVVTASGQNRQVIEIGSRVFGNDPYSSGDWYAQEALRQSSPKDRGFGPQINTYSFTGLFSHEPWQAFPHWEVFILNTDLTSGEESNNFVFGSTDIKFPFSVQSVIRMDRGLISNDVSKEELVRRLLRHEVGHMFGLPRYKRGSNLIEMLGTHCTNICTMRQGLNIEEWVQQYRQERASRIHFCIDCKSDLDIARRKYVNS